MTATDQTINRHKARLLQNLEDINCPKIYLDAIRAELDWLRRDINEIIEERANVTE